MINRGMGMSFFDKVSKAASAVGEAAKEQQRKQRFHQSLSIKTGVQ